MRIYVLAATLAAAVALPATAASARHYGNRLTATTIATQVRQELRECRRELRRADSRWEYQRELRECRREIRDARRDRWRDDRYSYRDNYRYDDRRRYWDGYRWRYRY